MKRLLFLVTAAILLLGLSGCSTAYIRTAEETVTHTPVTTVPPTTQAPVTEPPATEAPTTQTTQATEPPVTHVEVFREGEGSLIPVEMVQGTVGNYTIAMDPEYFTFYPQETVDLFSYDAWEEGPGVFYAISNYQDDADPQQFVADTLGQYAPLFASCSTEETTLGAYPATAVYLNDFTLDPAYQYHIFLVNCDGNYYLLEASFAFEMYEGLYAIMQACFDTMAPVN